MAQIAEWSAGSLSICRTVTLHPETGQWEIQFCAGKSSPQKERKMAWKRHSEEKIIYALKQMEGGSKGLVPERSAPMLMMATRPRAVGS
jgi:hypothetical protein